jgi:hypothetical protein
MRATNLLAKVEDPFSSRGLEHVQGSEGMYRLR